MRSAVPAVEAYYSDTGTYNSMTLAALQARDPAVKVTVVSAAGNAYCIRNSSPASPLYYKNSPGGAITTLACT